MKINLIRAAAVPFILLIGIVASKIAITGIENVKTSLFNGAKEINQKKIQPAINSAMEKISPTTSDAAIQLEAAASGYEIKWVKAKPLKECLGPDNLIDNDTVLCTKDHYEEVPIYENEAEEISVESSESKSTAPEEVKAE